MTDPGGATAPSPAPEQLPLLPPELSGLFQLPAQACPAHRAQLPILLTHQSHRRLCAALPPAPLSHTHPHTPTHTQVPPALRHLQSLGSLWLRPLCPPEHPQARHRVTCPHLSLCSPAEARPPSFQDLVVTNKATLNSHVQDLLWMSALISLG